MNKKLLTSILKAHQVEGNNFYFVYDSYLDIMDSHAGAIILAKLIFWANGTGEGDSFSKTDQEIMLATRSNKYQVKAAKKKVQELGLFETETKGMPRKTFYTFDIEKFAEVLDNSTNSSMSKIDQLVCLKSTNKLVQNRPTININKEKNKINKEKIDSTEYNVSDSKTSNRNLNQADCKNLSTPSGFETSSQTNSQTSNLIAENTEPKQDEVNESGNNLEKLRQICKQLEENEFQLAQIAKRSTGKLLEQHQLLSAVDNMIEYYTKNPSHLHTPNKGTVSRWFQRAASLGKFEMPENPTKNQNETVLEVDTTNDTVNELNLRKSMLESRIAKLGDNPASEPFKKALKNLKEEIAKLANQSTDITVNEDQASSMFDISLKKLHN